jgi:hypothetical protein
MAVSPTACPVIASYEGCGCGCGWSQATSCERERERVFGETGHVIVKFILSRLSFPGKIVVFYVEGKVSNTSDQTFSAQ